MHHVIFHHRRFEQQFPQSAGKKVSQKEAYNHLIGCRPYDVETLLTKRLGRYLPVESIAPRLKHVLGLYKSSSNVLGFAAPLSHLRAICNHWYTSSRFGNKDHPCVLGCGDSRPARQLRDRPLGPTGFGRLPPARGYLRSIFFDAPMNLAIYGIAS